MEESGIKQELLSLTSSVTSLAAFTLPWRVKRISQKSWQF